jgi:hypothetical protein
MFSLRSLIWDLAYDSVAPDVLSGKEIIVAIVIALLLAALYWPLKLVFFRVTEDIHRSKTAAIVMTGALCVGWLVAALDLLGIWATLIALSLLLVGFLVDIVYLIATR